MKTAATLFSGGGGADIGLQKAGFDVLWGNEKSEAIAQVYQTNFPDTHLFIQDIRDLDPKDVPRVNFLHASPPCQQFSRARTTGQEKHSEGDAGDYVVKFLKYLQPDVFTLENVPGYSKSISFNKILAELDKLGYYCLQRVVNFSDYGVPQSRTRLFLIASQKFFFFPNVQCPHGGWYQAISHLIDDMKDVALAEWQTERIQAKDSPPLLMPRCGACLTTSRPRSRKQPAPTIRAFEKWGGTHWATIILEDCAKKISIEATAALSTFPSDYKLPCKSLSQQILGNSVPPQFMKAMSESIKENMQC